MPLTHPDDHGNAGGDARIERLEAAENGEHGKADGVGGQNDCARVDVGAEAESERDRCDSRRCGDGDWPPGMQPADRFRQQQVPQRSAAVRDDHPENVDAEEIHAPPAGGHRA
jgi:hypothetical protein